MRSTSISLEPNAKQGPTQIARGPHVRTSCRIAEVSHEFNYLRNLITVFITDTRGLVSNRDHIPQISFTQQTRYQPLNLRPQLRYTKRLRYRIIHSRSKCLLDLLHAHIRAYGQDRYSELVDILKASMGCS
jgi:hypothetical protein